MGSAIGYRARFLGTVSYLPSTAPGDAHQGGRRVHLQRVDLVDGRPSLRCCWLVEPDGFIGPRTACRPLAMICEQAESIR